MSDTTPLQRRNVPADAKSTSSAKETDEELQTLLDPTTCSRKGLCPVTHIRGQDDDPFESHSLYYEIHGTGPERVVLIMGYVSTPFFPDPLPCPFTVQIIDFDMSLS